MQAETVEDGLTRRLAALSPGRRALLQRLIQANTASAATVDDIPAEPRGARHDFPLSAAQERMWFNHEWSPTQPLYNESFGLIIRGGLNTEVLERSFDHLMKRHEIFSVTFHSGAEGLFQRMGSSITPRMQVHDLRGMAQAEREAAYESESKHLLREPFLLQRGPLFRAGVWITGEDECRLIFVMHHIIFDGWSGGIFLRELLTAYTEMVEGHQPGLPSLGAQYLDFVLWEQSQLARSNPPLDRQLEYWKQQLEGVSGPPALPVDRQAPDTQAHAAGREVIHCTSALTEGLKDLAKESGATLFMVLLAAFKVLLARYSGQDDIVIGIPTTNRSQGGLRDMIGVFINTAILRTDLSGVSTFREVLGRVRKTTLDAQANQELPLQRVVRLLDSRGDAGGSLIRVLFDLQKKPGWFLDFPGLSIEPMEVTSGVAKFDIVLALEDTGSELKGVLDYDAEKFEAATAQQLVRHFVALVESAVAEPDLPLSRLPMLSSDELAQAELRGLDTSGEVQPFACAETTQRALESPDALALQQGRSALTYGQLHARATRLAAFLRRHDVGSGQQVALFLPSGTDFVVAQLAVMMTGAAFVPIDPAYPETRVEFILRDCGAKFAIVNAQSPQIPVGTIASIDPDRDCPHIAAGEPFEVAAPQETDPAYLIYTSGSTGQPKGVSVSCAALANLIAWHRRAFSVTHRDRATQMASVAFDASIWEVWPYLAAGASLHFPPRDLMSNAAGIRDWLVKNKITLSFAPTYFAEELIALRWPETASLRYLFTGGDRLRTNPPPNLPFQFVNNYGPTENTVVTTSGFVSPCPDNKLPSIGRPVDNVWLRIVDSTLQPVPAGGTGELIVGGRSLADGYWNRPELTHEKFVTLNNGERAYRTGDLCRLRRDGEIEFCGRADTQVKVRGCRIELGEIESALMAHHLVRDAVARITRLSNGQNRLVAYVVAESQPATAESLRTFLSNRLPSYMIPSSFVWLESLPKTIHGKIDQKRLPLPNTLDPPEKRKVLPRTTTEIEIAALWKSLLQVESVAVGDDFFELGGDSLSATRFATSVRKHFEVELPLSRMMSAPTIEALSAFIETEHRNTSKLPDGMIVLRLPSHREALPPLFFTPPASGSPACYTVLAGALAGDRAVYGFEAAGLTSGKPTACVTSQARQYVAALQSVYPDGPCYIAGWSLGGPAAFEMACQLRDAGRQVVYLALIDAGLPENGRLPGRASMIVPLWWAISYPFVERIPLNYQTVRMLARWVGILLPESLSHVWRRGWKAGRRFAAELALSGWRSLRVFVANIRAFRGYRPRPYDGAITLFRTAQGGTLDNGKDVLFNNLRQWCRDVDVHEAPGSHMTLMLDPKLCSAFASSFEATLEIELAQAKLESSVSGTQNRRAL